MMINAIRQSTIQKWEMRGHTEIFKSLTSTQKEMNNAKVGFTDMRNKKK